MMHEIQLTAGPSREDLFDGLRLFAEKRQIDFFFIHNGRQITLPVSMKAIEAEDGSGNCWNLQMILKLESIGGENMHLIPLSLRKAFMGNPTKSAIILKAFYSSKTRKGTLTIKE